MDARILRLVVPLLLLATAPVLAQETIVPFDSAGRIDRIDEELERRLALFPEVSGLVEARLYRRSDSLYRLEILRRDTLGLMRETRELDGAAFAALRARVDAAVAATMPTAGLDRSGRTELVTIHTALAMTYHGVAAMAIAEPDEGTTAVGVYMLTSGLGFVIPYLATRSGEINRAEATLANYGGVSGIAYGHLLYGMLGGDYEDEVAGKLALALGSVTSVIGSVTGYSLAKKHRLEEGHASNLASLGAMGFAAGAALSYIADADDYRIYSISMIAGSGIGYVVGNTLSKGQHYAAGDATFLTLAGTAGAALGAGVTYGAGADDEKVVIGMGLAGLIGGVVLGDRMVHGYEFSRTSGDLASLGTLAGALIAIGGTYVLGNPDDEGRTYMLAGSLGYAAGLGLMYAALSPDAVDSRVGDLSIDVSPIGLLGLRSSGAFAPPLVSIGYRM